MATVAVGDCGVGRLGVGHPGVVDPSDLVDGSGAPGLVSSSGHTRLPTKEAGDLEPGVFKRLTAGVSAASRGGFGTALKEHAVVRGAGVRHTISGTFGASRVGLATALGEGAGGLDTASGSDNAPARVDIDAIALVLLGADERGVDFGAAFGMGADGSRSLRRLVLAVQT